jgi:hypothetical protein
MTIVVRFGKKSQDITQAICSPAEQVGSWVYKNGEVDGLDWVRMADPLMKSKVPAIGVIIEKSTDTLCKVQWAGETPESFSGLTPGAVYFLGADALLSNSPPQPNAGSFVYLQPLATAVSDKKVRIAPVIALTKLIGD